MLAQVQEAIILQPRTPLLLISCPALAMRRLSHRFRHIHVRCAAGSDPGLCFSAADKYALPFCDFHPNGRPVAYTVAIQAIRCNRDGTDSREGEEDDVALCLLDSQKRLFRSMFRAP